MNLGAFDQTTRATYYVLVWTDRKRCSIFGRLTMNILVGFVVAGSMATKGLEGGETTVACFAFINI